MKKKIGQCTQCRRGSIIVNFKNLCSDCVFLNSHGKTRIEMRFERKISKIGSEPNKSYKPIKKSVKTPKNSEYDIFLEIWNERPHTCTNCGVDLERYVDREAGKPSVMLFSHIRGKGAAPELKYDKNNIELLCPDCHRIWEFGDRDLFERRKIK